MPKKTPEWKKLATCEINSLDIDVDDIKEKHMSYLHASLEDLKAGRVQRFTSVDELLEKLESKEPL